MQCVSRVSGLIGVLLLTPACEEPDGLTTSDEMGSSTGGAMVPTGDEPLPPGADGGTGSPPPAPTTTGVTGPAPGPGGVSGGDATTGTAMDTGAVVPGDATGDSSEDPGPAAREFHPEFVWVADFIREKCVPCHNVGQNGNIVLPSIDMSNEEVRVAIDGGVATTGRRFIEPFNPPESQIYIMITNDAGEQFSAETIDRFAAWIDLGAPYDPPQ